jgi:hypothetical protein
MAFLRADDKGAGVISSAKVARALNELGLLKDLQPSQVSSRKHCYGMSWRRMPRKEMLCDRSFIRLDSGYRNVTHCSVRHLSAILLIWVQVARALAKEAKLSLQNTSGLLTFSEFLACYERLERWLEQQARTGRILAHSAQPAVPSGWRESNTLRKAFANFCRFGMPRPHRLGVRQPSLAMSSQQWAKLCCDSGLLEPEGPLPLFAADIIFATCKPQNQRRLVFDTFLKALGCVAAEIGWCFADVAAAMGAGICSAATESHMLRPITSFEREVSTLDHSRSL